jgi:predicted lysophospholipase L1 biosynthesis ABC-type transport system permease subunit
VWSKALPTPLGLKLGDQLRFDIAGQTREARVTSLRKVDWTSMRANFFMSVPGLANARLAHDLHGCLSLAKGPARF